MKMKLYAFAFALALALLMVPTAHASSWDNIKEGAGALWGAAKEKGSEVVDVVKENGPGWVESAKDAASGAIDTIKEQAPGAIDAAKEKGGELLDKAGQAIQGAGEKVSDWNQAQQDEFWQRTETMMNGGNPSQPAPTTPDASPAPESSQQVDTGDGSSPVGTTPGTAKDPTDNTVIYHNPATTAMPGLTPSQAPENVPGAIPEADAPAADEFITYNGHLYQRADKDGELFVNDQMYRLVPEAVAPEVKHTMTGWQAALLAISIVAFIAVCSVGGIYLCNHRGKRY